MNIKNFILFIIKTALYALILTPNYCLAQLRYNYYNNSCPNVESIVQNAVKKKLKETPITAPATLRLFFHDCFVEKSWLIFELCNMKGCDASVILASPNGYNAEKDSDEDLSLAGDGFDTVIRAKAAVDRIPGCRNKVSCADILALAARDVILLSGGPKYRVELGRRDGRKSKKKSVKGHLPMVGFNYKELTRMFAIHGLSEVDMIALSGAHTIGFSHCSQFSDRLYKFKSKSGIDPTLDEGYAKELQKSCPKSVKTATAIALDPITPFKFDNSFYKNIQQKKVLLASDQALYTTKKSKRVVNAFASNSTLFERVFVSAMTRLGRVQVKTGSKGEIRRDCRFVNNF